MKNSNIAVIMSVYKNDKLEYLKEAINSLQMVDIFIHCDGKVADGIESYLDDLLDAKHIVHLSKSDINKGLAYSLNLLINNALDKGYHYIARMDSDDISIKDRFRLQYDFLEKHKEIDIVGGYIEEFANDFKYHKIVKYPLEHEDMFRFFKKRVPLAHVSVMYRDSYFQKAGFYPTTSLTNEDTLMWMEGFKNGCLFANIPKVLVKVRIGRDFFGRRGGIKKAWSDFKDRIMVIRVLRYNYTSYIYALLIFLVNIAPQNIKKFLYKTLR